MATLQFEGSDLRGLLDTLIEAVRITSEEGERPVIEVNGKIYRDVELLNVAMIMPDDDLSESHQDQIDAMFQKQQHGYRRTGCNLAHHCNQIAAFAKEKGGPKPAP